MSSAAEAIHHARPSAASIAERECDVERDADVPHGRRCGELAGERRPPSLQMPPADGYARAGDRDNSQAMAEPMPP